MASVDEGEVCDRNALTRLQGVEPRKKAGDLESAARWHVAAGAAQHPLEAGAVPGGSDPLGSEVDRTFCLKQSEDELAVAQPFSLPPCAYSPGGGVTAG